MFGSPDEMIVAAATAPAGGLRGIVRIAGGDTLSVISKLCAPASGGWPQPGMPPACVAASAAEPQLVQEFGRLPCELLVWPGPGGPLGGPLAEVQVPGSPPLVEAVVEAARRVGCRLAKGGEFSLRSFLAGRIDLVQAEAVLAVIDARSPDQLTAALDAAAGGIGKRLEAVRERLLDLLGDIEAVIDFGDEVAEGHGEGALEARFAGRLDTLLEDLAGMHTHLERRAATASAGLPRVVLAGPANVGKSSLFNALAGAAKALVADQPGTTRDWVEVEIEGAVPFVLVDLAGFEEAVDRRDAVDAAAWELARAALVIECHDTAATEAHVASLPLPVAPAGQARIPVWTRWDRGGLAEGGRVLDLAAGRIATSSHDGMGLERLRQAIDRELGILAREGAPATLRMAAAIASAEAAGTTCRAMLTSAEVLDEAVLAAELGRMLAALDEAIGRDLGNDLLDRIFSRHCIGK